MSENPAYAYTHSYDSDVVPFNGGGTQQFGNNFLTAVKAKTADHWRVVQIIAVSPADAGFVAILERQR